MLAIVKLNVEKRRHLDSDVDKVWWKKQVHPRLFIRVAFDVVDPGKRVFDEIKSRIKQRQEITNLGRFVILKLSNTSKHSVTLKLAVFVFDQTSAR